MRAPRTYDGLFHSIRMNCRAESTGPVKPAKQAKSSQPLDISLGRHEDTCFVANFPADMTAAKLKELFQEVSVMVVKSAFSTLLLRISFLTCFSAPSNVVTSVWNSFALHHA